MKKIFTALIILTSMSSFARVISISVVEVKPVCPQEIVQAFLGMQLSKFPEATKCFVELNEEYNIKTVRLGGTTAVLTKEVPVLTVTAPYSTNVFEANFMNVDWHFKRMKNHKKKKKTYGLFTITRRGIIIDQRFEILTQYDEENEAVLVSKGSYFIGVN